MYQERWRSVKNDIHRAFIITPLFIRFRNFVVYRLLYTNEQFLSRLRNWIWLRKDSVTLSTAWPVSRKADYIAVQNPIIWWSFFFPRVFLIVAKGDEKPPIGEYVNRWDRWWEDTSPLKLFNMTKAIWFRAFKCLKGFIWLRNGEQLCR